MAANTHCLSTRLTGRRRVRLRAPEWNNNLPTGVALFCRRRRTRPPPATIELAVLLKWSDQVREQRHRSKSVIVHSEHDDDDDDDDEHGDDDDDESGYRGQENKRQRNTACFCQFTMQIDSKRLAEFKLNFTNFDQRALPQRQLVTSTPLFFSSLSVCVQLQLAQHETKTKTAIHCDGQSKMRGRGVSLLISSLTSKCYLSSFFLEFHTESNH